MDPQFNAKRADKHLMRRQMANALNKNDAKYVFQPSVKIQLLTTSDGKKLGGIRLSVEKPLKHCAESERDAMCNKKRKHFAIVNSQLYKEADPSGRQEMLKDAAKEPCRKKACLRPSPSEVEKLEASIRLVSRSLH